MIYHQHKGKSWDVLEKQFKLKLVETLNDDPQIKPRLTAVYGRQLKLNALFQDLTESLHISVSTFVMLCVAFEIGATVVDDDTHHRLILETSLGSNSHVRMPLIRLANGNQVSMLWRQGGEDKAVAVAATEYTNVFPKDVQAGVCQLLIKSSKQEHMINNNDDQTNNNRLFNICRYKLEELQAMCVKRGFTNIQGTGRGGKIVKADYYKALSDVINGL